MRSPWYLRPWALALGSLLVAALLFVVYRARVAFLVGLERHRTRVAMDLHDKMGSGLGSIGILSGVLEDVGLGDEERREVAGKISDAAEELGTGLSDIVWSLDPRAGTLEELSGRLAEHAERLLSRDGVSVELDFPESWPGDPLDFQVRRNVLLIGMEALHNVARHADPRRVRLSLEPSGRYRWELRVEDDGCGLRKGAPHPGRGRGLESMGQRAREVDAEIEWSEPVEGGTRVVLRFDPSGGGPPLRRLWQRLRRWLGPDLT
ncbi:MAG: hypothetical protein GWN70_21775 [Gemmatimonadetes bacterium]|nr:hypothetical protein [Gemmatimonadota bacterium]